ncbi:MAG: hypothetical protein ACO1RT_03795 [Planctomycetaceae bacterium]
MNLKSLLLLACCLLFAMGCGESTGELHAPSGNELQQYLAEHPELNEVEETDDTSNRN